MHELSHTIFDQHQIRKTRRQKAAFRACLRTALEEAGYAVSEETSPILKSTNVVVGDVARAEYIFTAHYDTCAVLPAPNFIAPCNLPVTLAYQLLLAAFIFAVVFGLNLLIGLFASGLLASVLRFCSLLGVLALFFLGPANRHTANDNTSGVLALVEALMALPPQARGRAAFVFFDNEELGLFGSSYFHKLHGKAIARVPLINFDCVGDGDSILLVLGKGYKRSPQARMRLEAAVAMPQGKQVIWRTSGRALYPSDQMHFPMGVGVVALRRAPVVGYYIARIHTPLDTRLDETNLDALRGYMLALCGTNG